MGDLRQPDTVACLMALLFTLRLKEQNVEKDSHLGRQKNEKHELSPYPKQI